jgi:hypothetical protein
LLLALSSTFGFLQSKKDSFESQIIQEAHFKENFTLWGALYQSTVRANGIYFSIQVQKLHTELWPPFKVHHRRRRQSPTVTVGR